MWTTQHSQQFPSGTVVNSDFVIHLSENALFADISILNRIIMMQSSLTFPALSNRRIPIIASNNKQPITIRYGLNFPTVCSSASRVISALCSPWARWCVLRPHLFPPPISTSPPPLVVVAYFNLFYQLPSSTLQSDHDSITSNSGYYCRNVSYQLCSWKLAINPTPY